MNEHVAWYAARSSGIVAWALVAASVIWGLLLSGRVLAGRPTPKWLLDLHRFLGALAVTFTVVHVAALVADNYTQFGADDLLVPFASQWKPGAVAMGVVGLWLLAAVELTSLWMKRLPRKLWKWVHLSSYVLFWMATFHGLAAGSDASSPAYLVATNAVAALVVFLTLYRVLAGKSARTRAAAKTSTPTPPQAVAAPEAAPDAAPAPDDRAARIAALKARRAASGGSAARPVRDGGSDVVHVEGADLPDQVVEHVAG
jgi:methionine sulfoxide reductase heme-binding subunit